MAKKQKFSASIEVTIGDNTYSVEELVDQHKALRKITEVYDALDEKSENDKEAVSDKQKLKAFDKIQEIVSKHGIS